MSVTNWFSLGTTSQSLSRMIFWVRVSFYFLNHLIVFQSRPLLDQIFFLFFANRLTFSRSWQHFNQFFFLFLEKYTFFLQFFSGTTSQIWPPISSWSNTSKTFKNYEKTFKKPSKRFQKRSKRSRNVQKRCKTFKKR